VFFFFVLGFLFFDMLQEGHSVVINFTSAPVYGKNATV
jgi:hypothetical protein